MAGESIRITGGPAQGQQIDVGQELQIGRSGRHISQEAVQLHGGIGVTAEYPVSHYAARLTAINQTLGSADAMLLRLLAGDETEAGTKQPYDPRIHFVLISEAYQARSVSPVTP